MAKYSFKCQVEHLDDGAIEEVNQENITEEQYKFFKPLLLMLCKDSIETWTEEYIKSLFDEQALKIYSEQFKYLLSLFPMNVKILGGVHFELYKNEGFKVTRIGKPSCFDI